MSRSVLDADMATVARWLGEGWRWWTGELAAMLPAGWTRRLRASARGPVAWFDGTGPLRFTNNGRSISLRRGAEGTVAVPPALCLSRTIEVPALGEADVRRLVSLQLDRLMPFPPGAALFDFQLAPASAGGGRRAVTVGALLADTAVDVAAAAREAGVRVRALRLALPDGSFMFDFLPALRAARGEPDPARRRRNWWRAAAILFVLNLLMLVATDMLALRNEERLVQAHADSATLARLARRRVLAEQAWRQRLLVRRSQRDPAALLGRLTHLLPPGAVVQRLVLEDGTVRLTGVRGQADMVAALRAGPFRNVRNSSADVLAATPEGQPFDISFDLPGETE